MKRLRKPAGYAELIKALVEEDTTVPEYLKNLNIKDAMYLCDVAWKAVSQECVSRCWGKALGTTEVDEKEPESEFEGFAPEEVKAAEDKLHKAVMEAVPVREILSAWSTIDDDVLVAEPLLRSEATN